MVLGALARGVLGPGYSGAVPHRMVELVGGLASDVDKARIMAAFRSLATRGGALALTGRPVPVSWLTADEAEAVVRRWKGSRIRARRDLASLVIAGATAAAYGHATEEWERIGYPGPLGPAPPAERRLHPSAIAEDSVVKCDVVVVGSGAGGGCVAGELAARGLDVVVLEKGAYRNEADFTHVGAEAFRDMYLYGGFLTTTDLGIRILAGSTLGGGTTINWSTSWKTPRPVLDEWAHVSGIDAFASGELEASLDAVCERLGVNDQSSPASKRDELLEEGLKRLGWHVDLMPRNVRGCSQDEACGFCCYGCRVGAKQSTLRTYLEDAEAAGATLITRADVRKVLVDEGRATGVQARCGDHRLRVEARAVVVAAGAIETPALLLRSGLGGRVGHNLRLHPGTLVAGVFDEEVRMWEGVMQARYSNELGGPWSGGYGPTLETGPFHPNEWAVALPWTSSEEHRERMGAFAYTSPVAVLSRDRGSGRVKIDRRGAPRVEYGIDADDEARFADGAVAAARVLEAAGAREVFTLHKRFTSFVPDGRGSFERWEEDVRELGFKPGSVLIGSMHQMGSCAMGTDPATSAVNAENETHEVKDLFVTDASTFPTASGVNPMISVFGIAHRAAQKIASRLG